MLERLSAQRRLFNFAGFGICAALIALAYGLQYWAGMEPCPLCIFQRMAVVALGLVFLLAAVHAPSGWGARMYGLLIFAAAGSGGALALRHLWLQSLPPDQVPACGPGLDYMLDVFPLLEVIQVVLQGSGECAEVERVLGMSIPGWTLLAFIGLGIGGVLANWSRRRA